MLLDPNSIKRNSCVFIVPRSSFGWKGNEAGWISVSGWATAGQEIFEEVFVATTDGIFSPDEVRLFPKKKKEGLGKIIFPIFRKLIPEVVITAFKDWNLKISKPETWPIERHLDILETNPQLVWQRHDLFPGPGKRLAEKYKVPLVTSVEALVVWEAEKWGVRRPIWGQWLQRKYEIETLKKSDLICCISEEVQEKLISLGISPHKIIITSNKVDPNLFNPQVDGVAIREEYQLSDHFVIGWVGSFRKFHALEDVVLAFEEVRNRFPNVRLMLVGDGLEFRKIQELVISRGLTDFVTMTGKRKFEDIPKFIASMDITVVSAGSAEGFHYYPLKLAEYMALGKAVVAPRAGDLPKIFMEGSEIKFFDPGNGGDLAASLIDLIESPEKLNVLRENSIAWFANNGSWSYELKRVCRNLGIMPDL